MKKFLSIIALLMAFAATGFADTWTVAGNAAALNGDASWAEGNADNDMTSEDGTNFTLTVTDCTLEVGTTYEFKVVKDHSWNNEAYPGSNYQFTVAETAVYTVVYTFNASTHNIDVTTTKTGEAGEITHTYTVAGSSEALFGSTWAPENTNNDMAVLEGNYYIWQKENVLLDADFSFKVCVDHSWALSYPAEDYGVELSNGPGYYDVQIIFDAENHTIDCVCALRSVEISSVVFSYGVAGADWSNLDLVKGDDGKYTATLDLSEVLSNQDFKLNIDNGTWLGTNQLTLNAPENVVTVPDGIGDGQNFTLLNATSGYSTYTITAEWTEGNDVAAGWTLTIEGGEQRTVYHSSVTFATGLNWNKVYAYVWKDDNGEITNIVEWPGIEMTVTDEEVVSCGEHFPVYGLALESFVDVNKVIFNDGTINDPEEGVNKTGVEEYQDAIPYRYMIPEPAEIASVILKGGWTTESTTMEKQGDTYVYTADIDLTDVLTDQNIQLFVNNGESALSNLTVDTEDGGIALTAGENGNYLLPNATSGYKDYTVTATWAESTDANVGWTIKVVGKTARPNATIESVVLSWGIAGASTWNNVTLEKDADSDVYTGELELYNIEGNRDFQLVVDNNWLGYGELELTDPENLVTVAEGVENFTLNNANSPYETYTVTATWTANPDALSGWELKIEGKDKRVYTYTLVNVAGWENVRAYAWNANGEVTDSWPGNVLEKDAAQKEGYDAYTYSVECSPAAKPTGIIFNNGKVGDDLIQTQNIPFEQGGIYYNGLAYYTIVAELFGEWIDTGFELEDNGDGTYSLNEPFGSEGERFAIAPNTALVNDLVTDWSQVIIPVTEGGDWLINYFTNYSGTTKKGTSAANDKVWLMGFDDDFSPLKVTIDPENNTFTIESSATETLAIGAAGYATYSNDKRFTVSGDDVEVYFVEEVGTNVKMTKKEDAVLPGGSGKGKGILLKGSGNVIIKPAPADVADTDVSANLLAGSGNNTYVISGDFGNGDTYNAAYVLKNGEDGVGFYYINLAGSETDRTLAANKAFLAFNKSSDARGFIGFDDMTTGIETIENVQLTNGTVYNLNGQRVAQPTKGLYIVNGKKVLVK